jgi:hypothetical protein
MPYKILGLLALGEKTVSGPLTLFITNPLVTVSKRRATTRSDIHNRNAFSNEPEELECKKRCTKKKLISTKWYLNSSTKTSLPWHLMPSHAHSIIPIQLAGIVCPLCMFFEICANPCRPINIDMSTSDIVILQNRLSNSVGPDG